ncbi:hypothetical protein [Endozoicomonas lisbonensis]|uniref:hypothetical protein n=1 Tax=Endozoicomonas lisbonensis TaxID=3120522 RepID=UPI003391956C
MSAEPETSDFSESTSDIMPITSSTEPAPLQAETEDLSDSASASANSRASGGEHLAPAITEALTAIENGQPLSKVSDILNPLIESPTASRMDKAQAHYAKALTIKTLLHNQVKTIGGHVCSVYNYGQLIRQYAVLEEATGQLQLPDIEQLREYTRAIEELSTIQPLYASIQNMTASYAKTLDAIADEQNTNPAFMQQLNQLREDIKQLSSSTRLIYNGCMDAQIIYGERGALLQKTQQKTGERPKKE